MTGSYLSPEKENCVRKLFFTGSKITLRCLVSVSMFLVSVLPPFLGFWHSVICMFQLSCYKKWVAWGHWFITGIQLCFHLLNDILKASILNIITLGYPLSTAWMIQLLLNALLSPEHRASRISSMFSVSQLLSLHSSGFSQEHTGRIRLATASWKHAIFMSLLTAADFSRWAC